MSASGKGFNLLTLLDGRLKVLVNRSSEKRKIRSFTLVELLIVIAILAVLAASVVIVLNPAELLAQARDTQRVSDVESMKKSVDLFIVDNPTASLGTAQRVYISLPSATAPSCDASGLPTLPSGWQYACSSSANLRKVDGTGWIPINFGNIYGGSPIPYLPIDPANDAASGRYYTYVTGGSYELTALMEAQKENTSVNDGGFLPGVFEAGTDLSITPPTRDKGLVGYWMFDESSGTTAYDSSGKGNNGTLYNGLARVSGQSGSAVSFDGVDDYTGVPYSASLAPTSQVSFGGWVYRSDWSSLLADMRLISKTESGGYTFAFNESTVGSGNAGALVRRNGTYGSAQSTHLGLASGWHFFFATYDGRRIRDYIDGSLMNTNDAGGSYAIQYTCNNSLLIGAEVGCGAAPASSYFSGYIDEVRVYNRVLSDAEIKAIYNATN